METTNPECERRREARFPVMLDAEVLEPDVDPSDVTLLATTVIENLSQHGAHIYVRTPEKKRAMDRAGKSRLCSVLCRLPGVLEPSFLTGIIAWTDIRTDSRQTHIRLGVRLTDTVSTDRNRLEPFLSRFAQRLGQTSGKENSQ